jgi:hypothetical protein
VRVLLRVSKSAARNVHTEISSLRSGVNPTPSANQYVLLADD